LAYHDVLNDKFQIVLAASEKAKNKITIIAVKITNPLKILTTFTSSFTPVLRSYNSSFGVQKSIN
jgi:hypothetical protein